MSSESSSAMAMAVSATVVSLLLPQRWSLLALAIGSASGIGSDSASGAEGFGDTGA